jgi:hypothetical protein
MPGESARINGRKGGRPKGTAQPDTLRKMAIRRRWLTRLEADADKLYDAQMAQALGTKHAVARDKKTGKFIPLDDEKVKLMIACGMAEEIELWDRPPSTPAAQFLADRAIDKPSELLQVTGAEGGPLIVQWKGE